MRVSQIGPCPHPNCILRSMTIMNRVRDKEQPWQHPLRIQSQSSNWVSSKCSFHHSTIIRVSSSLPQLYMAWVKPFFPILSHCTGYQNFLEANLWFGIAVFLFTWMPDCFEVKLLHYLIFFGSLLCALALFLFSMLLSEPNYAVNYTEYIQIGVGNLEKWKYSHKLLNKYHNLYVLPEK